MIDIPEHFLPKDEQGREICPKCQKADAECTCPGYDPNQPQLERYSPKVLLEKKGRKGKTVTVINGLPADQCFLRDFAKKLKCQAGSGGTSYVEDGQGVIELQGDHRGLVHKLLKNKG
ncbi:MAG: hypothetical protein KC713_07860 [Candidatus Omnitrophica bacterium]|nr:hypothetical protein [Candidatus Omnitrophota bacterium]